MARGAMTNALEPEPAITEHNNYKTKAYVALVCSENEEPWLEPGF